MANYERVLKYNALEIDRWLQRKLESQKHTNIQERHT